MGRTADSTVSVGSKICNARVLSGVAITFNLYCAQLVGVFSLSSLSEACLNGQVTQLGLVIVF